MDCAGIESRLSECPHEEWGANDCVPEDECV